MEGNPTSPKNSRYQVVPALEDDDDDGYAAANIKSTPPRTPIRGRSMDHVMHHHDDDDETNSLVEPKQKSTVERRNSNPKSIFRKHSQDSRVMNTDVTTGRTTPNTSTSSASKNNGAAVTDTRSHNENAMSINLSRSGSLGLDSDWEEEDDEANLRRYRHLDIAATTPMHGAVPLPAEFSGIGVFRSSYNSDTDGPIRTCLGQCWTTGQQRWTALRQAARQRRAARLLTMPSESFRYKVTACLASCCCDATDAGIAFTVAWLTVWLVVGWIFSGRLGTGYWMAGLFLFVVRVTARRCYEGAASSLVLGIITGSAARRRRRLGSSFRPLDSIGDDEDGSPGGGSSIENVNNDSWHKSSDHSTTPPPPNKDKHSNRDLSATV